LLTIKTSFITKNGEDFARPVYWPYDPSLAMTNISERQCKRGVAKYGSRSGHLAGQPEAIRLRDLKLLLRAREVAYSLLTCKVSEQEVEKMLFGLGVAIDMARSLLISQKGRKRYLREMLGNAVDAPFAGKVRVFFDAESVELEATTGSSLIDQIMTLERARGKGVLSVLLGGRRFLL